MSAAATKLAVPVHAGCRIHGPNVGSQLRPLIWQAWSRTALPFGSGWNVRSTPKPCMSSSSKFDFSRNVGNAALAALWSNFAGALSDALIVS